MHHFHYNDICNDCVNDTIFGKNFVFKVKANILNVHHNKN